MSLSLDRVWKLLLIRCCELQMENQIYLDGPPFDLFQAFRLSLLFRRRSLVLLFFRLLCFTSASFPHLLCCSSFPSVCSRFVLFIPIVFLFLPQSLWFRPLSSCFLPFSSRPLPPFFAFLPFSFRFLSSFLPCFFRVSPPLRNRPGSPIRMERQMD